MADIKKIIEGLHPLERKVLPVLASVLGFNEIISKTGLKDVEVMRALQWLDNKGALKIKKDVKEVIVLDKNGEEYVKSGLPEKRVLQALSKGNLDMDEIISRAKIQKEEFGISVGTLKKKAAILMEGKLLKITEPGRNQSLSD